MREHGVKIATTKPGKLSVTGLKGIQNMILDKYTSQYINILKEFSVREKIIVALCNLQRQMICVEKFDEFYNENLSSDFRTSLNSLVNYLSDASIDLEEVKKTAMCGPDTDDYPETEGTVAQNACGSLYYLYTFLSSKDDIDLLQSIDKCFESADAINYDEGTQEEEDRYFAEEARNLKLLIERVKQSPTESIENIRDLLIFAQEKSIKF